MGVELACIEFCIICVFLKFLFNYSGILDEAGILEIQRIMFLITWFFLYWVMKKK